MSSPNSSGKCLGRTVLFLSKLLFFATNLPCSIFPRIQNAAQEKEKTLFVLQKVRALEGKDFKAESQRSKDLWVEKHSDLVVSCVGKERSYIQGRMAMAVLKLYAKKKQGKIPTTDQVLKCALRQINTKDKEEMAIMEWYWTVLMRKFVRFGKNVLSYLLFLTTSLLLISGSHGHSWKPMEQGRLSWPSHDSGN